MDIEEKSKNFQKQVVNVKEEGGYILYCNFEGKELCRIPKDMVDWIEDWYVDPYKAKLQMIKMQSKKLDDVIGDV